MSRFHLIDAEALKKCEAGVHLLNFARGEIIDGAAVRAGYDSGKLTGKYASDFSDPDLMGALAPPRAPALGRRPRGSRRKLRLHGG